MSTRMENPDPFPTRQPETGDVAGPLAIFALPPVSPPNMKPIRFNQSRQKRKDLKGCRIKFEVKAKK